MRPVGREPTRTPSWRLPLRQMTTARLRVQLIKDTGADAATRP